MYSSYMNGEAYFSNYLDVAHRMHAVKAAPMVLQAGGGLALKLVDLYASESIADIGALPEPEVVQQARATLAEVRSMSGTERVNKFMQLTLCDLVQTIEGAKDLVIDGVTDPEELKAFACVAAERDSLNACVAEHHDRMLSQALVDLHQQGTKGKALDKARAAQVVKQSVNGQRKQLAEMLAPWQAILLAHYDFDPNTNGRAYSIDIIRNRNVAPPEWLQGTTNPDGAGQLLSSMISEAETLVVLNEWVVDRGLPYLPVISPVFFETGPYIRSTGNPHADLFLCSLVPGCNDLIPIQVKSNHSPVHAEKYIDGMVFITPQDLGQYEQTHTIMKTKGKAVTGLRYTARYGAISTQFMKLNLRSNGRQPTKVDRNVYGAQLETAFQGLDRILGGLVERKKTDNQGSEIKNQQRVAYVTSSLTRRRSD